MILYANAGFDEQRQKQNTHALIPQTRTEKQGRTCPYSPHADRSGRLRSRSAPSPPTVSAWTSTGGFTLIELMVSLVIVLIIATVTIKIEANVFESNGRSINMIQLTQQMRSAIQLVSRDIRRAGYNDDALASFLSTQAVSSGVTMGALDANGKANCLQVSYDDLDGTAKNVVYRLRVVSEVGRIAANFGAAATCDTAIADAGWVDITDPLLVSVTSLDFVHNNQLTDIAENLSDGNTIQVGLEQISVTINASLRGNNNVTRSITNEVQIRNQYLTV